MNVRRRIAAEVNLFNERRSKEMGVVVRRRGMRTLTESESAFLKAYSHSDDLIRMFRGLDFLDPEREMLFEIKDDVLTRTQLQHCRIALHDNHRVFIVHPFTETHMIMFEMMRELLPLSQNGVFCEKPGEERLR